jgi:hypothetical protein
MTIKEMKVEIEKRDKIIKVLNDMINELAISDEYKKTLITVRKYFYFDLNDLQKILDNAEIEVDNIIRLCEEDI